MAKLYPFSEQTRKLLENIPQEGETHLWLAKVAGGLKCILPKEACFAFLRAVCDVGVRHRLVPDREIEAAVELAYGERVASVNTGRGSMAWPMRDDVLVSEVLGKTEPLFDVEKDSGLEAGEVLKELFRSGELVCAGASNDKPRIRPVEEWEPDAGGMQFICVNPMKASFGKNKEGGLSIRCQGNVKVRRFLVAEFDDAARSKAEQAVLLSALSKLVPLVLVVDSGGKSLHGWFRVEDLGAKDQVRFFAVCCVLGADRTRWDICGWLRMPGGMRRVEKQGAGSRGHGDEVGVRQRILYFGNRTSHVERPTSNVEGKTPLAPADTEIGGPVGKAGVR